MDKKILGVGVAAGLIAVAVAIYMMEPESVKPDRKIGLVINTPNQTTSLQELDQIYLDAASSGIGRSNVYLFWDIVEPVKDKFDWQRSDILMGLNKKNDLDVTLYFSVINGRTLGPFPDWIGNPPLNTIDRDHLLGALDAILSRYDIIDTVIIAGETESQFRYSEQSIPIYKELFADLYSSLKERHPDVKIGNAFALHNTLNKNLEHIVTELALGDFVGFTYFPVDSLNEITKSPSDAKSDLETALAMVPGKKVGFMEVGWSTSDFVGGSQENQLAFVKILLEFYSENESDVEFITWYRQYDRPENACTATQRPADGPGIELGGASGLGSNQYVVERLNHYTCKSGMLSADGIPKPSWAEFKEQLEAASQQ